MAALLGALATVLLALGALGEPTDGPVVIGDPSCPFAAVDVRLANASPADATFAIARDDVVVGTPIVPAGGRFMFRLALAEKEPVTVSVRSPLVETVSKAVMLDCDHLAAVQAEVECRSHCAGSIALVGPSTTTVAPDPVVPLEPLPPPARASSVTTTPPRATELPPPSLVATRHPVAGPVRTNRALSAAIVAGFGVLLIGLALSSRIRR